MAVDLYDSCSDTENCPDFDSQARVLQERIMIATFGEPYGRTTVKVDESKLYYY